MIQTTFRPIQKWPREFAKGRKRAPFGASYSSTLKLLDRELRHLSARAVVIQLALRESDVKLDGSGPYANARPDHPGVILAFEGRKTGAIQMPCDTYSEWQANLRAIALTLERLRAIDRHGVTQQAEQYTGWRQLPPGAPLVTPKGISVDEAIRVVSEGMVAGTMDAVLRDAEAFRVAYRLQARRLHPDANGGHAHPDWQRLQEAKAVLERHHGL